MKEFLDWYGAHNSQGETLLLVVLILAAIVGSTLVGLVKAIRRPRG